MQAYFRHSYRDVPINTYFSELFATAGITLRADQKTDVWCTAKLERYLFEMDGFVSIIPRRIAADESITYSPYIARELMLARRSRGPRILFVDAQLLTQFQSQFPPWAVPFFHDEPGTERARHANTTSEIVLKASAAVLPVGSLPLADPKLKLAVASSSGKIVHVVATNNLRPLYSCVKVRDPLLFGKPSVVPVRGRTDQTANALGRPGIEDLLDS